MRRGGALGTSDSALSELALGVAGEAEGGASAGAELASGTGSALGASVLVAPRAELASGAGEAFDATVSFATGVFVDAGLASGAGTANGGTTHVAARAGVATGAGGEVECDGAFQPDAFQLDAFQICEATPEAGLAYNATAHPAPNAGLASGTGVALDATGQATTVANAGLASGTGAALAPRTHVAPNIGTAVGTGVAHDVAAIWADDNYDATPEGDIATGYMPPLAAPIDDDDTTITVEYPSTTDPEVPFVVIVDGEQMLVTDVSGTTWTVERGYDGTTATSHGAGTAARPALVRIRVGGVLMSADVSYQRSRFTTASNGQPGTAEIWVRDLDRTRSFVTGAEVIVKFRGIRMWGGYVASIRRQYVFPSGTGDVGDEPRWLILDCVDYNVLFNKRIFFKPGDADRMAVRHWPNGTRDAVVIRDLVNDYLTLGGDDLRYDIQHVGTPALPQISCNPDAPDVFGIGSAGWTWGEVMNSIVSQTGAVYYIDPDKTFRYVDDSTKQSRFGWAGLSDTPNNTTRIGYRDVEFTSDGARLTNDHLQWGAGQGSSSMVFSRVEDEDSIDAHGRWQTGELRFDLYCQDSVDRRAETWVYGSPQNRRGGKDNRFFSRVTVREPYFRVADVLVLQSTEFDFSVTVPVRASEITFPTPWDVKCVLTMAHELDAPWSTFEFWIPTFDFDLPSFGFPGFPTFPPFPGVPDPWGPLDPCEQVSACIENFSREVEEGWGSWATDSNIIWQTYTGSPTAPNVTGGLGEILGSARMLTLGMAPGLPVEILVKFRHQSTSSNAYDEFGIGDPATSGDVNTLSYDDRGSDHRVLLNHNGTSADFDLPVGWTVDDDEWWWARYRMLSTTQSAGSMWPDSEPEPEDWQVQVTGAALGPEYEITAFNGTIGRLGIESIEITEGMCPDGAYLGETLGLPGFVGTGTPVAGWGDLEGGEWVELDQSAGPKHVADPENVLSGPGYGILTSYEQDVNNAVGGHVYTLGPPFTASAALEVYMELTIVSLPVQSASWDFRVGITGDASFNNVAIRTLTSGATPPGDYKCRVSVPAGSPPWTMTGKFWAAGDAEPGASNMTFQFSPNSSTGRIVRLSMTNPSNTLPVALPVTIHVTHLEADGLVAAWSGSEDCADDNFNGGGLIAAWGAPGGAPGGSWTIIDSGSISSPDAFSGNSITEGIFLSAVNDVYYGGIAYLDGGSFDEISEFLLTFIISPMCPTDNPSSVNGFNVGFAMTPSQLTSPTSFGQNIGVTWNSDILPANQYTVSGIGTTAHSITEGTMYAIRYKVDEGAGTTAYKFWEPEVEDEPSYAAGAALTVGQVAGVKIGVSGGNLYPAGTRPEVNGVTYSLSYGAGGESAGAVPPAGDGCIDCGDAEPREFEDPPGDGPEVGDEPGDRLPGTGENGGIVFQLNAQYQLGSTEVWVDGLRIRLGSDYLEFPRNGKIEILDHIDVGTEGDPATIRVNYIIWTIDDPIPE